MGDVDSPTLGDRPVSLKARCQPVVGGFQRRSRGSGGFRSAAVRRSGPRSSPGFDRRPAGRRRRPRRASPAGWWRASRLNRFPSDISWKYLTVRRRSARRPAHASPIGRASGLTRRHPGRLRPLGLRAAGSVSWRAGVYGPSAGTRRAWVRRTATPSVGSSLIPTRTTRHARQAVTSTNFAPPVVTHQARSPGRSRQLTTSAVNPVTGRHHRRSGGTAAPKATSRTATTPNAPRSACGANAIAPAQVKSQATAASNPRSQRARRLHRRTGAGNGLTEGTITIHSTASRRASARTTPGPSSSSSPVGPGRRPIQPAIRQSGGPRGRCSRRSARPGRTPRSRARGFVAQSLRRSAKPRPTRLSVHRPALS